MSVFFLTANATELDPTALEELRQIVGNSFQPALYQENEELGQYSNEAFSKAYNCAQPNSTFDLLPPELLVKICIGIDDAKPFCQGVGLTCHLFYAISKYPVFSLNPYCLTETRPHNIPQNILRIKICNTEDALFRLAALYSVSGDDLVEWFGKELLDLLRKLQFR